MDYEIKRGNIIYVSRIPVIGHEQFAGRPAIIVSSDAINEHAQIVEVVYLTTQQKPKAATHVPIHSSKYPSIALCEQVTTVSVDRLGDRLGSCTKDEMRAVNMALMESVGLAHVLRGVEYLTLKAHHKRMQLQWQMPSETYTKQCTSSFCLRSSRLHEST